MRSTLPRFIPLVIGAATVLTVPALATDTTYHLLKEIPVREGGAWAALAIDGPAARLYAAHGSRIEIINLKAQAPLGAITDTPDIRDLALAPTFHMGFASSGKNQAVHLIDLNNMRTTAKMKTGAGPGAVVYEPSKLQLFSCNPGDHTATAGEADDGDFLATIDLGGNPTSAIADATTYESKNGRILCSLEDKNEIVAIDVASHQVLSHWPVAPGAAPRHLAYDAAHHRLFIACGNRLLVTMDSTTGKVITSLPIGEGAGGLAYDSSAQNIFTAGTDGTVTIAHEDTPDKISIVQTLQTKTGPTVLAVDEKTHNLYLGTAQYGSSDVTAGQRPSPMAGSLKIAIYGQ